MKKIIRNLIAALCIQFSLSHVMVQAQNIWQPLSGPSGGPVYDILTGNQLFDFCISPSGIFRTSNNGDLWTLSSPTNINNLFTGSVGSNGYIYAATSNYTTLLYRSADNGNTWQQSLDGGLDFNAVASAPNGNIYAGTFYMFSFHGQFIQEGDIFRSTNNGESWITLNFPSLAISSLKINSNNEIFAATTEGLFKSGNNGGSFSLLRSGSAGSVYINSQNHIFIYTTGNNVLRSTDNGSSWITVSSGPDAKIPIAEDAAGNLFTGHSGKIYKSIDNGLTWNVFAELSPNSFGEVSSIRFKSGNKILVSASNGVFRSDNSGANFIKADNGIRDPQVKTMAVKNDIIITGSFNSVSRSTDNGNTWALSNSGLPNREARLIEMGSSEDVFVYMPGMGLYRSPNNGAVWSELESLPGGTYIHQLKTASENKVYVTTGEGKVLRSNNSGDNWTNITGNLPDSITFFGFNLDPQNNLYVSVQRASWFDPLKGIYKSTNDGASWYELNAEIIPEDMAFNSQGIFFAKFGNALLKSTNGGLNFITTTSTQQYVIDYVIDNSDQIFMSLAENKIYKVLKSNDNGVTWTDMTGILSNQLIYELKIDVNACLLAATQSGLYRTSSPTAININENSIPDEFRLMQNYPNPFNPVTVIRYSIPSNVKGQTSNVKLTIYNLLGKEVSTLVNEKQNPGNYSVKFNGINLSSGMYFYKIESGEFVDTKKMLLIK